MTGTGDKNLPQWSPRVVSWFRWYCRRYFFPPHFHCLRILRPAPPPEGAPTGPLVVVVNHPSWWDPVICALLTSRFPGRRVFTPMDAKALETYKFFKKMGFFGVEQGTVHGAATFLRIASRVLEEPDTILWITAQGHFTDPRQRPIQLMPGLGKVLTRVNRRVSVLPLALEYPFWDEKNPEALIHFGEMLAVEPNCGISQEDWTDRLSKALEATMDQLAKAAITRDAAFFETMETGKAGVGGMYDRIRKTLAWIRFRKFDGSHAAAIGQKSGKDQG